MALQAATLIFPHQLFKRHPAVSPGTPVILVEEFLFFRQYPFHQQKLLFHRATMKSYEAELRRAKHQVRYIDASEATSDVRKLIPHLAKEGVKEIHYAELTDDWLEARLRSSAHRTGIRLTRMPSPNFLTTLAEADELLPPAKRYSQTKFYIGQRKRLGILLTARGTPAGGRWTYDTENRKRYPSHQLPPKLKPVRATPFHREAAGYVEQHFATNYGTSDPAFGTTGYPATRSEAEEWLKDFLTHRFAGFGPYEDAIVDDQQILHHSLLSPLINVGLLSPEDVVEAALAKATKSKIPLSSLEGFIRQVIGWREFIRVIYERHGRRQRTTNFWGFSRTIPRQFWTAETGILPVDTVIRRFQRTGYAHHIERLMVLGNFFLLCEFDPDDVYRWFMEMSIDAYDWVMVPNVYGMSQFADGGLMSTKPYFSGSNYLMKMSNFPRGEWQKTWDGLFWRFIHVHGKSLKKNPRLNMLTRTFQRMSKTKRQEHLKNAETYLHSL